MQHTFYFYLSIFVKKKCYFYSVTLGSFQLLLLFLPIFYSERESERKRERHRERERESAAQGDTAVEREQAVY